jgi:hypothetical protein
MPRLVVCLLVFSASSLFEFGWTRPSFAQPGLLSPAEFLGYELGDRFTFHHRMVAYFEHVASQSPRVRLETYGETYEGRPLITAFVTSPDRIDDLEAIRQNNLRSAGLLDGLPEGPSAAIVWLGYNVHGNEAVSMEAAMRTLYDLADPANAKTGGWLEETVVVIDPCLNPDGRDRYAQGYTQRVGRFPDAEPRAWEHEESWPGGRTNHYYFDLNRDWSWMTQQEVAARVDHYSRWMPHVHVDFHEQGVDEPYYFAPAAEPYHALVTPWQREFQKQIGDNNASYFDRNGWLYFTGQVFDLLYPGYGDSWPTYNGSVGMTYDQGGSGRAGLGIVTAESDTLTLRERIDHHYATGMATIETTVAQRERVLTEFRTFFSSAVANPPGTYRTFVLKEGGRTDARRALETHLSRQGIRYGFAAERRSAEGIRYRDGATTRFTIEPGDLIVGVYQPKATLVQVLFEPKTDLSDSLTYDITAWSLPYVYGLEAFATIERYESTTDVPPVTPHDVPASIDRPYAYLLPWEGFDDARFLAEVLRRGLRYRYAEKPFSIDGRTYPRGTLLFTRAGHESLGARFDEVIRTVAAEQHQAIYPVKSGRATAGADFGSSDVVFAERPRVAVLMGAPTRSSSAGEVWHFFDRQLGYPVTVLDAESIDRAELDDFHVVVMPAGAYGDSYSADEAKVLKEWVEAGGRLIALESAVRYLAGQEGFRIRRVAEEETPADSANLEARRFGDRDRAALRGEVQGAIFAVDLDTTHPLAFGYLDTYYTLRLGDDLFERLTDEDDWNVGVLSRPEPLAGFVGTEVRERLGRHLVLGIQEMGDGNVVYFADNPLFRGFWYGGRLLLANAVFFR